MEYSSPSRPVAQASTALASTALVEAADEIQTDAFVTNVLTETLLAEAGSKITEPQSSPADRPVSGRSTLQIFLSTFLTIFLAELGDKTQMTTLLMSAESHAPWVVFAGAGTALVATSLIGVWLGCWLAKRIAPETLEKAAGCLLLLISTQLFWELLQG